MKWFKRLFFLPLLVRLHSRQVILQLDIEEAQKALWFACDMRAPEYTLQRLTDNLEKLLEELSDVRDNVRSLWGTK